MPGPAQPAVLHVVAIVPVGTLNGAKSRLGAVLDAEERLELTILLRTVRNLVTRESIAEPGHATATEFTGSQQS